VPIYRDLQLKRLPHEAFKPAAAGGAASKLALL